MRIKEFTKWALSGALAFTTAFFVAGAALAQVPSFQLPPFQPSTFVGAATFAAPQTGAGDLFCIAGSASRLVKVKRVVVSGVDTTAQASVINLVKRSTANTGGTSTAPTAGALDSQQVVTTPTAVLAAYTVIPTPGTSAGTVGSRLAAFNTAATASASLLSFDTTLENNYSDIRLRGVAQELCVNAPSAFTTAGPTLTVEVTWTEQ